MLYYLYLPPSDWSLLRQGLRDAFAGDGSLLLAMLERARAAGIAVTSNLNLWGRFLRGDTRVIAITGTRKGIGRFLVEQYLERGWTVVGCARGAADIDDSRYVPREIQWFINARKDEGERPQHIEHLDHPVTATWVEVYRRYQDYCNRGGLVDFAELLLRAHELWLENPGLLDHYRRRLQHLLIDEFQDTNAIQYAWLRLLAGKTGIPFAVGRRPVRPVAAIGTVSRVRGIGPVWPAVIIGSKTEVIIAESEVEGAGRERDSKADQRGKQGQPERFHRSAPCENFITECNRPVAGDKRVTHAVAVPGTGHPRA